MVHERIYLDPKDSRIYIDTYIADDRRYKRPAMLVFPGGGYRNVCSDREGEPIALAYLSKGFNCFVMNYGVQSEIDVYPKQLIDASRAILEIRRNAEKYCVDAKKVYAVGFSAGGHLAGSLGILHDREEVLSALNIKAGENRPDAVVLSYPVVTAYMPTHIGSFENLLLKPFDTLTEEDKKLTSLELNVTKDSSPAFIWHTATDACVPVKGTLDLAKAYVEAGVTFSLRIYPYGIHGLALANHLTDTSGEATEPIAEEWLEKSIEFLNSLN